MSGSGRRVFQPGEVLTASNVMSYLQDQAVMVFAGTAARGSALGTATVSEGMVTYLQDSNFVEVYDGTGWRSLSGVQVASGTANRDALLPSPIQGDTVFRNDLGMTETYFTAYGTANLGGAPVAGWYPMAGIVPAARLDRSSTAVSLANNAITTLTTGLSTTYAVNGMTVSSQAITVPIAGIYRISAGVHFLANATGARYVIVTKNTASGDGAFANNIIYTGHGASASANSMPTASVTVQLAANDVIRLCYFQNSGGTLTCNTSSSSDGRATFLEVVYVSASHA